MTEKKKTVCFVKVRVLGHSGSKNVQSSSWGEKNVKKYSKKKIFINLNNALKI